MIFVVPVAPPPCLRQSTKESYRCGGHARADIMALVEPAVGDPNNPDDELDRYSITVCTKDSVRKFTPALPGDALFRRDAFFRDILVKKRTLPLARSCPLNVH